MASATHLSMANLHETGLALGYCGHCFPGASGLGILSWFFFLFSMFRIALQQQVQMKGWVHGMAQWWGSKHPPALVPCFWASIYTFLSYTSGSANLIHLLNQIFSSFAIIQVLTDGQCLPNDISPSSGKKKSQSIWITAPQFLNFKTLLHGLLLLSQLLMFSSVMKRQSVLVASFSLGKSKVASGFPQISHSP